MYVIQESTTQRCFCKSINKKAEYVFWVENIVIGIRNVLDLTVYLISPQITKKVHVTLQYMNTEETPRIFPCPLTSVDDYILENNRNMISVKSSNILYVQE